MSNSRLEQDILVYSIRYCMSRDSYAFVDGLDILEENKEKLNNNSLSTLKRDVDYALKNKNRDKTILEGLVDYKNVIEKEMERRVINGQIGG